MSSSEELVQDIRDIVGKHLPLDQTLQALDARISELPERYRTHVSSCNKTEEALREVKPRAKVQQRVCDGCGAVVVGPMPQTPPTRYCYWLANSCGHRICKTCLPTIQKFQACVVCHAFVDVCIEFNI